MIDQHRWNQFGEYGLDIQGIILHNTSEVNKSALDYFDYFNNNCRTSQASHYLVDNEGIVEVLPLNWKVYSTELGKEWSFEHCISITICANLNNDLYNQGQEKAIELIKQLMNEHNLTINDIYFHNNFNPRAYCPHILLDRYGSAKRFAIEELEE